MGNIQAQLTEQTLAAYTSVMNSAMNQVINDSRLNCSGINNFNLSTGQGCTFQLTNGTINFNQVVSANCQFNSENNTKIDNNFKNSISTTTKSFIDTDLQNSQGWFATAFSFQITGASNSTEVTNQIVNSISNDISNTCAAETNAYNNSNVNLCGVFDGVTFNFSQNANVTALVSCINRNVINIFVDNEVLNDLWSKTDSELASQQSGVDTITNNLVRYLIIGAIVIAVIVAIVFIIMAVTQRRDNDSIGDLDDLSSPPE